MGIAAGELKKLMIPVVFHLLCLNSAVGQPQLEALRQTKIREKEHHQPFQMTSDMYMVVSIVICELFNVFLQTTSQGYLY